MQPPCGPHFQWHAVAGARHDAEQAELAFARSCKLAQRGATGLLAASAVHRHAQLGTGAAEADAAMLDGDDRRFALAAQLARDRFSLDRIQRRLRAQNRIATGGAECECGLERVGRLAGRPTSQGRGQIASWANVRRDRRGGR